MQKLSRWRTF